MEYAIKRTIMMMCIVIGLIFIPIPIEVKPAIVMISLFSITLWDLKIKYYFTLN